MRETLLDIVKHVVGVNNVDTVKVTGSKEATLIEAMDNERTVIIKANLHKPVEELEGEFGIGHLTPLLQGLLTYPNYKADGASIDVKRKERNGRNAPEEIIFKDAQGQTASFRLMNLEVVPEQAKFLGTTWDVEVEPGNSKISEFNAIAQMYSGFENYFLAKTVDKELRFYIGDEGSSMHKAFLTIASDVEGSLTGDLHWPISQVLQVLKLGKDENVKLQFTNRGALQIMMSSPHAEYKFILPARKK